MWDTPCESGCGEDGAAPEIFLSVPAPSTSLAEFMDPQSKSLQPEVYSGPEAAKRSGIDHVPDWSELEDFLPQHEDSSSERVDRDVARLFPNVSALEQTVRFLPSKVTLFHLELQSSQAGVPNA